MTKGLLQTQQPLLVCQKSHLPLPLGEVAERSEVGEGLPIFCENREKSNICNANIR